MKLKKQKEEMLTEAAFLFLLERDGKKIIFLEFSYCKIRSILVKSICNIRNVVLFVIFFVIVGEFMLKLEERILKDGKVFPGNILKVDSFLNHQIDVELLNEIGKELARLFEGEGINKILTIEASGIGIACVAAQYFSCPVLFAKKTKTKNIANSVYKTQVRSFTHGTTYDVIVSKDFIGQGDKILIIDDFLAEGNALLGLIDLCRQAGAEVAGCGIAIEKGFQNGAQKVRELGIRVESLAVVESMSDDSVVFRR